MSSTRRVASWGRAGSAWKQVASIEAPLHHGSHTGLLSHADATAIAADIDAIVVPTIRKADCLRAAFSLATELGCPVVPLCSRSASAHDAVAVSAGFDVSVIAIDSDGPGRLAPVLETSQLLDQPRFRRFRRVSDLSAKRNLGLLLARVAGWRRVLFLDDDISQISPAELRSASGLLPRYSVIGLDNQGFPDNSVVCHAYREVGGAQEAFIGGGAMLLAPDRIDSFFPDIYSEDWLFLYDAVKAGVVARSGQMLHKPYDPYADPRRAASEEFGDTLAEGLYRLLDDGKDVAHADEGFWETFLRQRRKLIATVLRDLRNGRGHQQPDRMIASLKAARGVSAFITPKLCTDYLHAWCRDHQRWRQQVGGFRTGLGTEKALAELGLVGRCVRTPSATCIAAESLRSVAGRWATDVVGEPVG